MQIPTRLRIVEGRVVLDDGSDPTQYLKDFALKCGVSADEPVCVMKSSAAQSMYSAYVWREDQYALAS